MELNLKMPIREVSSFQRVLCTSFNGVEIRRYEVSGCTASLIELETN